MADLETKRSKLELMRVQTAKAELEFKIEERLEEIGRLKEAIIKQDARAEELKKILGE
jgi:hypothetical protein